MSEIESGAVATLDRPALITRAMELQGVKATSWYWLPEWQAAEGELKPIRAALGLNRWQHVTVTA